MLYKYLISSDKTSTNSLYIFEKDKTVGVGEKERGEGARDVP